MLSLVMPFLVEEVSAAGTNCTHQWLYVGEGVSDYIYYNDDTHGRCSTDEYRCIRCGARYSVIIPNSWIEGSFVAHGFGKYIDLGHMEPYSHMFQRACSDCAYTKTIIVKCYGPPCPVPQSAPVSKY